MYQDKPQAGKNAARRRTAAAGARVNRSNHLGHDGDQARTHPGNSHNDRDRDRDLAKPSLEACQRQQMKCQHHGERVGDDDEEERAKKAHQIGKERKGD